MRKSALYILGLVVAALVALGLVVLSSASEVRSLAYYRHSWHFVMRQVVFVAVGTAGAIAVARIDYRRWRDDWPLTVVVSAVVILALLAVFLFPAVKGSKRWIPIGVINFQPSEFAKLACALALAVWMDRAGWKIELFAKGALVPAAIVALFAAPILLEPDFGSVMVIAGIGFMLMFTAGTRILHMLPFAAAGVGVFLWELVHNPNRMARLAAASPSVTAILGGAPDPGANAAAGSAAYQSGMSIYAIFRGGIFGVGLGRSMQKQNYLPEAWTDFIFAVGAEEMGLVFSLGVMALFLAFFGLSVYVAWKAADRFGRLLALGMASIVFFQAMFNIGVVCEAFPTKGMALPFFSYGGTNMIASLVAVGFIFSVGLHSSKTRRRPVARKVRAD
ncbi:MAG: putative lipid II flippase FtsW [Kiritimatiellae bacterium]|nr:putative lipid II flippase FtsW [Kiritimatiellia bacterium]